MGSRTLQHLLPFHLLAELIKLLSWLPLVLQRRLTTETLVRDRVRVRVEEAGSVLRML